MDIERTLNDIVVHATKEALNSCGFAIECIGRSRFEEVTWEDAIAFIGLAGEDLKGSVALSVPFVVFERNPPTISPNELDRLDWLGELTNVLAGRIKRRLVAAGARVQLSTPLILRGRDLCVTTESVLTLIQRFLIDGETAHVLLGVQARDLVLTPDAPMLDSAQDLVLF